MNIIVNQRQRSKPKYFVYYNDWTGEILSVGTAIRDDSPAAYLETDNPIAGDIIKGLAGNQNFIVCDRPDSQKELSAKSEFLHFRKQEDQLFLLPRRKSSQWDIRVRWFTVNNKLVIEANQTNISKLVSHNAKNQIKLNTKTVFEFYLVHDNDPDYLIDTVRVDAEELINKGRVYVDVAHLTRHAASTDVTIMARRYFENYYFEVVDERLVEPGDSADQSSSWNTVQALDDCHVELVQHGKYLTAYSKVSADQLYDQAGLWRPRLDFFVVGETPDHYLGTVSFDVSSLRVGQADPQQIDFDLDQIELMYANPRLRVGKRKTE